MAGKIFEMAFNIAAKLNSSFNNSFAAASNRLVDLSGKIEKLEKIQKQADGMVALGRKIRENTTKFNEAQRRVQQLAQAIRASGQPTRQMQRDYENAQREVSALNRVLVNQRAELRSVSSALNQAGFSTRNFRESQRNLRSQLETARNERASLQPRVEAGNASNNARAAAIRANENAQRANAQRRSEYQGQMIGAVGMAAPIVLATKTAMDFESKMSRVQAITNANEENLKELTAKARELGSTTQFTATQAAEAMSYLGMAGWNTGQIIGGMPGLLNLAAAGNVDLARTADIVSDTMTAMGLDAAKEYKEGVSNAMHVADVFAYTITKTNTDVTMMGETMKYAAPVAKAFGASVEETAALTGLMANAGIKASQAGTSLRAGFLRLAGPPKKASKALEEMGMSLDNINTEQREAAAALASLGISMDDMSGKPKKMSAILRELYERTADFTEEQKISTLGAIFGQNAVTGWLAVLDQGPEAFDKMTEALENCDGTSKRVADTMTNNARGAIIGLESAVESVSISLGNVLLPSLAWTATEAAKVARKISAFAEEYPTLTKYVVGAGTAIAGLTIGVTFLGYAYTFVKGGILGFNGMLLAMRQSTIMATAATKGLTAAKLLWGAAVKWTLMPMKLVTAAQWAWNAAMRANPIGTMITAVSLLAAAGIYLYNNWDTAKAFFVDFWNSPAAAFALFIAGPIGWVIAAGITLATNWEKIWDNPSKALEVFVNLIKSKFSPVFDWLGEKWQWVSNLFSGGDVSAGTGSIAAVNGRYASGGFITRPHIGLVGEAGPEAIIPLNGSQRALSLWQKTGQMLGVFSNTNDEAGGFAQFAKAPPSINNTGVPGISLSAPINITINGNADSNTVKQIQSAVQAVIPDLEQRIERKIKEMQWQERRTSLA